MADQYSLLLSHLFQNLPLSSLPSSLPLSFSLSLSLLSNCLLVVLLAHITTKFMFGMSMSCIVLHRITCLSILGAPPISVFFLFASDGPSAFDILGAGGHELEELLEEFELLGFDEGSLVEGFRFWNMIVSPFLTPRLSMLRSQSLMSKGLGGNPEKSCLPSW